jgi:hypothetical protein
MQIFAQFTSNAMQPWSVERELTIARNDKGWAINLSQTDIKTIAN